MKGLFFRRAHPLSEEALTLYLDGRLPPRERVEAHLRECPQCRRHLEQLERLRDLLRRLPLLEPSRPLAIPFPLEQEPLPARSRWAWALYGAGLASALALVVVGAGDLAGIWGPSAPALPPAPVGMTEPPTLISPGGSPAPQVPTPVPPPSVPAPGRPFPLGLWPVETALALVALGLLLAGWIVRRRGVQHP